MSITLLDGILLLISIFIIVRVTAAGFIHEFFSAAAFLLAAAAGFLFSGKVIYLIRTDVIPQFIKPVLAFFAVFIVVFILIKCIQMVVSLLFENEILGSLDHALGFFLGIFEAGAVIFIILFILYIQPFVVADAYLNNSIIGRFFLPFIIQTKHFLH